MTHPKTIQTMSYPNIKTITHTKKQPQNPVMKSILARLSQGNGVRDFSQNSGKIVTPQRYDGYNSF